MKKKLLAAMLAFCLALCGVGCNDKEKSGAANTSVFAVSSGDKILQSYDVSTAAGAALKKDAESKRKQTVEISAYKNEYESKQILFTSDKDVESYDVTFSDLTCGENTIGKENITLYHEYYHLVETIYDAESKMIPGMYPDALIPLADAKRLGFNKVKAGNTQGVYATLYVPKTAAAGVYTGTATVTLDGTANTLPVRVRVFDYTLPDEVSIMSCIPLQRGYLFNGELDNSESMYAKYAERLRQYRLSVQYLNSVQFRASESAEDIAYILERETTMAAQAAKDVSVSSYAIRVYSEDNAMGAVLNEDYFYKYLCAYVDGSIEHNVNLLKKAYVYMGNIIDEPDLGGEKSIARANYVCKQFDKVLAQAVSYARGKGASSEVVTSLEKLPHVVTGPYVESLTGPQSYCPTVDKLSSAAEVDRYRALRESGKSYWWYTCTVPKIPYPTIHLDDNGVSARTMGWMAKEYDVDGYLTWEAAYYMTSTAVGQTTSDTVPAKGMECYDNVHRWGDTFGDGFVFYPGAPLGIDGPVDSMRLPALRDGMEDYEALLDLEKKYAVLGADASGVLGELYATLYGGVKVYCTSDEVDSAHERLGELLELANKGVAISEFMRQADGKVTASITIPEGKTVTLNGTALEANGGVCAVNDDFAAFTVACDGVSASVPMLSATAVSVSAENCKLYDRMQEELQVSAQSATVEDVSAVKIAVDENASRFSIDVSGADLRAEEGSVELRFYSSADMTVSLSLQGNTRNRLIDTFAVKTGWNVLRFDRLQDLNMRAVGDIKYLNLSFTAPEAGEIAVAGITLYK